VLARVPLQPHPLIARFWHAGAPSEEPADVAVHFVFALCHILWRSLLPKVCNFEAHKLLSIKQDVVKGPPLARLPDTIQLLGGI
jgi:hypothetical protein